MESPLRYRSFSILANLSELESFILHDPSAQNLYQQYLAFACPNGQKANHIPFFADIVSLSEQMSCPKPLKADYVRAELLLLLEKYFNDGSELMLDIPMERLEQVRRNMERNVSLLAFKPAIKAVVRDLAFIHLDGFINSSIFREFKDNVLVNFKLSDTPKIALKEKESSHKLKRFFGDKSVQASRSTNKSLGDQPRHIKEYKLSKKFGERVGVEKTALLADKVDLQDELFDAEQATARRDRRLHIFFGDNFNIEDTLFSERVRSHSNSEIQEFRKQPTHVKSFRLAKFFGTRPPIAEMQPSESDDESTVAGHSKKQHLSRFFGENIDPAKEANSVSFAAQPDHVKACTLKKIFGESASHTLNFEVQGGTWPRSSRNLRSMAKLERIFGPYEA